MENKSHNVKRIFIVVMGILVCFLIALSSILISNSIENDRTAEKVYSYLLVNTFDSIDNNITQY